MTKAIYAGSFDPITNGHLWVIDRAAAIFDQLIVAVGDNPDKKYSFSLEERLILLKNTLHGYKNIEIGHFNGEFLVNYAQNANAKFIVRGIRNTQDYEYEKTMRYINSDLCNEIDTIFLMPPRNYAEVSSSLVKGLVGTVGWEKVVNRYVPETVLNALKIKNGS
ncbi:MAG: pantetheine-phosphate adenylyltransferase [Neisseriales bacterium]|jgi:pantetheine-phosphate adenylyltransferase|nr:MAG: pantetheine-phosphate adenylyltransferase [Neisseriales bacterium]